MSIGGNSLPAVLIDLNPDNAGQYGLSLGNNATIAAASNNDPKGAVEDDSGTGRWTPTTSCARPASTGRWSSTTTPTTAPRVRLGDVAKVGDSVEDVRNAGFSDDLPAVLYEIRPPARRQHHAGATDAIHAQLPVLQGRRRAARSS